MSTLFGTICGMVVTLLCGFQAKPHPDDVTWICRFMDSGLDSFSISLSKDWQPIRKGGSTDANTANDGKFVSSRKATIETHSYCPVAGKQELWDSINDMVKTMKEKTPERIRVFMQGGETVIITFLPAGMLPNRSVQLIRATRTNFVDRITILDGTFPDAARVDELVEMERAIKTVKILP